MINARVSGNWGVAVPSNCVYSDAERHILKYYGAQGIIHQSIN